MRTELIYYNERTENLCGALLFERHNNTNRAELKRKSALLMKAMEEELTEQQRLCATEHWLNGKKQKEIAAQLGLNCSTVSRHICAAKRKLLTVAKYTA